MVFPECRLKLGQTIDQWYNEEKEQLTRSYQFALAGLDVGLKKMQENCPHHMVKYDGLFYALGETFPGMRCDKCGYERNLTDKEKYPEKSPPSNMFKKLFKGTK
jgi:hypothetical protein